MFIVVSALLASPLHAQGVTLDTAALRAAITAEMRVTRTPGASIAVVVDGRVAYAQGFGVTSVEGESPMTAETL